jgi:hypothetical protein
VATTMSVWRRYCFCCLDFGGSQYRLVEGGDRQGLRLLTAFLEANEIGAAKLPSACF